MLQLMSEVTFEDLKGPLLFLSGMIVGVIMVAIIWYLVHWRKAHKKRQDEENCPDPEEGNEGDEGDYPASAIIVQDPTGDYIFEDKSQLGRIIDFKRVPRRETERQTARRDLVIQMLIAESMST